MGSSVTVSLAADSDGFISQECPACSKRFKVHFGEGSDCPIAHCPYCGHAGQDCWWTQEQADYLTDVAGREMAGPLLDDFARRVNRTSKPRDFLQISAKVDHGPQPSPPEETETPMLFAKFECCGERIKYEGSPEALRCVICGKVSK